MVSFFSCRVAEDTECWQDGVTNITLESVDSALDWILEQPMKTDHSSSSTTEGLLKAMSDDDVRILFFTFFIFEQWYKMSYSPHKLIFCILQSYICLSSIDCKRSLFIRTENSRNSNYI